MLVLPSHVAVQQRSCQADAARIHVSLEVIEHSFDQGQALAGAAGKPDNLAAVQVHDGREVHPLAIDAEHRDVGDEAPVGSRRVEIPLELIGNA